MAQISANHRNRHLQLVPAPAATSNSEFQDLSRDEAIAKIRAALKARSTKRWSVRGGRGTSWGWITIIAPPARCADHGGMTDDDCKDLGELFVLDHPAHFQGISVAASSHYRREYVSRAEGREPDVRGEPYWD